MLPALHVRLAGLHVVLSLYALCVAAGIAAGFVVAVRRARRPDVVLIAGSLAAVAGIAGAEAWHRIVHGGAGLSSMGGIAGALAALVVAGRRLETRPLELVDALAPGAVLGFGIGRVGCWLAGCCYGVPSDVAWAIVVPEIGGPPRHPVQLYEAALDVLLAVALARSRAPVGVTAARAMTGYGLGRVALESWRDPASVDLIGPTASLAQVCGALLVVAGAVLHGKCLDRPSRGVGS